jgi:hypothetical protein
MRDFSLPSTEAKKRGHYKLPERTQMTQDIYSLILEGYPYNKIMQQLQISERTFYRYLEVIFANDRRLLVENVSDEEFLNQMAICKDRLLEQRRDVLEMAHDPEIDDQRSQLQSFGYTRVDPPFYLKDMHSQRRLL